LQSGGAPGSSAGFARQASASARGAAPIIPSTTRVRVYACGSPMRVMEAIPLT
jgi:hypothetical protein